jgi:hypothetical protein
MTGVGAVIGLFAVRFLAIRNDTNRTAQNGMSRVEVYLSGYILFVSGVFGALWKSGVLDKIDPEWIVIGVLVVFGIGLMISGSHSRRQMS